MNDTFPYDSIKDELASILPTNILPEHVSHMLETGSRVEINDDSAYMVCDDGTFVDLGSPRRALKHIMFCAGLSEQFHA